MAAQGKEDRVYTGYLCASNLEPSFSNLFPILLHTFPYTSNSVHFLNTIRPLVSFIFCHISSVNMTSCTKNKDIFLKYHRTIFMCKKIKFIVFIFGPCLNYICFIALRLTFSFVWVWVCANVCMFYFRFQLRCIVSI